MLFTALLYFTMVLLAPKLATGPRSQQCLEETLPKGNEMFNYLVVQFAVVGGGWRKRGVESLCPPAVLGHLCSPLLRGAGFSMPDIQSLHVILGSVSLNQ